MFSIQSGSPFSLKKKMISDTFSHFGVIAFVFYQTGSSFGFVNFQSSEDAKDVCLVATRILYAEHEVMEVSREAIGKKGCEFVG